MWLQKRINKRFIKKAIWSDYVYQIEAENRLENDELSRTSKLKSFLQDGVNEMKKEIKKEVWKYE